MEKENPFCVWKLILLCFVYFHSVSSDPSEMENVKRKDTLIDKIKFCPTVNVIGNSSYIQICDTVKYPETFISDSVDLTLCMIVYDTTSKICEYFSKVPSGVKLVSLPSLKELDKDIQKFERFNNNSDICNNISSIFNKLNHSNVEGYKDVIPYLQFAENQLLTKDQCFFTCHSLEGPKINHLCTYLLWANEFLTSLKPIKVENDQIGKINEKEIQPDPKANLPIENRANNNEKQESQVNDKNETVKKADKTPNNVNESQNKQKSSSSTNKKSDDVLKEPSNTVNIEPKSNPKAPKQVDESNNHGIPAPPKEEDNVDLTEGDIDSPPHSSVIVGNQDVEPISAEDHQNKKENEEPEEGIDPDNADNDQKEPVKSAEDNDEFQQRPKLIPHSQILKEEDESHFFTYFSAISLLCIVLYIGYHNKQKIFAILLEGRRSRRSRGSRRRPSTASYRKLDCNLEEAVTSQCNSNVTHVIY